MNKRLVIGYLFLLSQLLSIIYARTIQERFFCWAPYDEHTYFEIIVKIEDEILSKEEIKNRYNYESIGWEPRSINNIFNIINQHELTYGKNDNALIEVKYSTNGKKEELWQWKK